jgi:hypothetical protein
MLTQTELKKVLCYDPETGIFTRIKNGKIAGTLTWKGYTQIKVFGKCYRAGRLAILYMEGSFPTNQVDHHNGIRNDDRYINLVCCDQQYNMQKIKTAKNNTTGIKGVGRCNTTNKYTAKIVVNKKFKGLGYYENKIDAVKARFKGERKYNRPLYSPAYNYLLNKGISLKEI